MSDVNPAAEVLLRTMCFPQHLESHAHPSLPRLFRAPHHYSMSPSAVRRCSASFGGFLTTPVIRGQFDRKAPCSTFALSRKSAFEFPLPYWEWWVLPTASGKQLHRLCASKHLLFL